MSRITDLRSYLEVLAAAGRLRRVSRPVSLLHELADVAAALARKGGTPVLFEQPAGSAGFAWPVFTNAVAGPASAALALGCAPAEIAGRMGAALEPANAIPPRLAAGESPPWQQNVLSGEQIDLRQLPIPTHGAGDGGPFITGGVTVCHDPLSGRGNLSYNRMQVLGKTTLGFNVNEWRHVMQFYKHQQERGQPLQVAVAIGLDPAVMIAAGARYDGDELAIAGALRGEAVPVCRGVSVDVRIPCQAEIVIEGYLPPLVRRPEGPLAEFHGYYGELWESPVLEVTAVCFRQAPIFQTIVPGWDEHIYIGNVLPREPLLLRFVRHACPGVVGLHIPPYGNGFLAVVQLPARSHSGGNPGAPKNAALAAFAAHVNIAKVIVVDDDINIYDPADVLWALTNRVDWSRDAFTIPGAQGHEMDPTADSRGIQTKLGVDATYKPERRAYGERVRYPDVELEKYV